MDEGDCSTWAVLGVAIGQLYMFLRGQVFRGIIDPLEFEVEPTEVRNLVCGRWLELAILDTCSFEKNLAQFL